MFRECRGRFAAHRGGRPLPQTTRSVFELGSRSNSAARTRNGWVRYNVEPLRRLTPYREQAPILRFELRPCPMCQGPVVVDDVLPAIITVILMKIPLEWLHLNHGVSLMPVSGLGDKQVRKSFIELVGGDIQVMPFEPQPNVP